MELILLVLGVWILIKIFGDNRTDRKKDRDTYWDEQIAEWDKEAKRSPMNNITDGMVRYFKKFDNVTPLSGSKDDPFYVYFYYIDGVVKYVGKGSVGVLTRYQRAFDIFSHKNCKPFHKDITVEVIETFTCENTALKRESELIAQYGLNNLLNIKG